MRGVPTQEETGTGGQITSVRSGQMDGRTRAREAAGNRRKGGLSTGTAVSFGGG